MGVWGMEFLLLCLVHKCRSIGPELGDVVVDNMAI